MKASEVMTGTVHAFGPDTPAGIAAHCLNSRGFTAAAVTDKDGNLIGIVTVIDLSTTAGGGTRRTMHRRLTDAQCSPVRDLMITPAATMTPGADIADIVALMLDKNIDWLPIVDGHILVGVITPADLFRAAEPPAD